jgi:hypothetical protein
MPRYKNIDGVNYQFSPVEEAAQDAIDAEWDAGAPARALAKVQAERRAAYQAEADHLHLEEERGEVPAGTWAAKVAEIKARFPK